MNLASNVLNGKEIAKKYLEMLSREASSILEKGDQVTLATIQVGDSKDIMVYSRSIENLFKKVGLSYVPIVLPEKASEKEICDNIQKLNQNPAITGIMVFAPLPKSVDLGLILNSIDIQKDAEGRRMLNGIGDRVVPPTAMASLVLIEETGCDFEGKQAVIIGRSDVVGKPLALLLIEKRATVTVCNSKTKDLRSIVQNADILIATAGQAQLVKGDWIKKDAIVIDVGENVVDGKLVGDVEFEVAKEKAAFISPVPGGVGPVTNVMLLKNVLTLHKLKSKRYGNR